ncbi:uncharacterized protein LOC125071340 [Vanessa atalanta]|uniref:uncharacterized protein LOC125071340 n=1 Tax=Vanessa atalanta TaxID=42275 RepID=UPI001FCCC606|nr:uncharacterized protein LOC125071340 [Vanessa atalanta]
MSSLMLEPYNMPTETGFDQVLIQSVIFDLADEFQIRISWDQETVILTGAFAVAGGLVGGYAGGRVGAAIGAGIGAAAGVAFINLRDIWESVKSKLNELIYIVFNYLRRLDPVDYVRAIEVLMACTSSRRELVFTILDFIADKLGRQVLSSITAA